MSSPRSQQYASDGHSLTLHKLLQVHNLVSHGTCSVSPSPPRQPLLSRTPCRHTIRREGNSDCFAVLVSAAPPAPAGGPAAATSPDRAAHAPAGSMSSHDTALVRLFAAAHPSVEQGFGRPQAQGNNKTSAICCAGTRFVLQLEARAGQETLRKRPHAGHPALDPVPRPCRPWAATAPDPASRNGLPRR